MLFVELTRYPIDGIVEMVPTYAALMVHYKPEILGYDQLKEILEQRIERMGQIEKTGQVVKEIPICYEGELGMDIEECATLEQVTVEELIRMHSEHEYYTYMLGFAPGYAYMARFKEAFHFKRRNTPRVRISAGSIVVQENLSNLIPFDQPCGWNIIGTTPLVICDYAREQPFLIQAGDWVKYVPVNRKEYERIKEAHKKVCTM